LGEVVNLWTEWDWNTVPLNTIISVRYQDGTEILGIVKLDIPEETVMRVDAEGKIMGLIRGEPLRWRLPHTAKQYVKKVKVKVDKNILHRETFNVLNSMCRVN
jgi:hypothetical protein